ncbi:MAG: hypothetical protein GXP31_08910 [Kiritimatiellaeota bacterium]|nr:hypothetical protein [Kiritimatiellota bacterium]
MKSRINDCRSAYVSRRAKFASVMLALVGLCALPAARGAFLSIQGHPLEIRADEFGTMGVLRWQNGALVRQYYSIYAKGSALFLNGADTASRYGGGESTFEMWTNANNHFVPVSHQKLDDWTIQTVFDADATGVRITQTISYVEGSLYYTITWEIANNGTTTFNDVRFIHGGDTYFAGDDDSQGHWDPTLRMVYLTNPDPEITGIMGFYGALDSPADHYNESYYGTNEDVALAGQLPDSVDPSYHDAGYALQWNRASLAPGDTWTITAFEKWTEAGFVQVLAPPDQPVSSGTTVDYLFTIQNFQSVEDTFNLTAASSNGWDVAFAPLVRDATDTVTVGPGAAQKVVVQVTVPDGTPPGTQDVLTVTATSQNDPTIFNQDSVTSTVTTTLPDLVVAKLDRHRLLSTRRLLRSGLVLLKYRVVNQGGAAAPRSVLRLYLSQDQTLDATDRPVTRRLVPGLPPGESTPERLIHFRLRRRRAAARNYYIIGKIDPANVIEEENEDNNTAEVRFRTP